MFSIISVTEEEKENEIPGAENGVEPVEVQVARDELKVLHEEKHKTERVKTTIQRELEAARSKTHKLEEVLSTLRLFKHLKHVPYWTALKVT